jgi:hypothetical protein
VENVNKILSKHKMREEGKRFTRKDLENGRDWKGWACDEQLAKTFMRIKSDKS